MWRAWRWSLSIGTAIPPISLMAGVFLQTVAYEIARNIPSVIQQDEHISLPICRIMPDLHGCTPGVGSLTGLEIWELSEQVGQISGLLLNIILIIVFSAWLSFRLRDESFLPGLWIGIVGMILSLVLALAFGVTVHIHSSRGIFGILALLVLPLAGWVGGQVGRDWRKKHPTPGRITFLAGAEAGQWESFGESLSDRELEVLALVAEGLKNKEIARRLSISQATVKTHLIHIYAKLGVENRTAAVTKALACDLLRQEEKEVES